MREDGWLAERLGRPVLTWEPGDDLAALAADASARGAFAQAKVPCDDVATAAALQDAGFRVVDVNVTLSLAGGGGWSPGFDGEVAVAEDGDRDAVLDIAERHFDVSRFHRDPAIEAAVAARVKRDWAAAYLDGSRGDRMLVARRDGAPVGFLGVIAPRPDVSVIDIVAVHRDARGSGAGSALVAALVAAGASRIDVGTQIANTGALRFYERLGFTVTDTRYVLHLHAVESA